MQRASTYLSISILGIIASIAIAFFFNSMPFHSVKNVQDDSRNHLEKKFKQVNNLYEKLQSKSNDAIAEEISELESGHMQLFVFGKDRKLKVWSHKDIPLLKKEEWWIEKEASRICYRIENNNTPIIGCELIPFNKIKEIHQETNGLENYQESNSTAEIFKFSLFFLGFLFAFFFLEETIYKEEEPSTLFFISGSLLLCIFGYLSEFLFDNISIFNSANYGDASIISPASLFFSSVFILLLCISFSKNKWKETRTNYQAIYFLLPSVLLALFLRGLEFLFSAESEIQFENISFGQFELWGYSLSAIVILYSIHLLFQTCIAQSNFKKGASRYSILATILITYLICHLALGTAIPWYLMLLYLLCYYFSLELNGESLSSKLIWSIWFLILNAGLLSSTLYYYTIKKDIRQTQEYLQNLYTVKDGTELKTIAGIKSKIENSSAFKSIFSLGSDDKFHKNDLRTYLNTALEGSSSLDIEDVFLYKKDGESRIINEDKSKSTVVSPYISQLDSNSSILYNPISNKLLFTFDGQRDFLYLALSESNIQKKKKKKNVSYGLFSGRTYRHGDIKRLPEIAREEYVHKGNTIIQKDAVSHIFHSINNQDVLYAQKTYSNLLRPISLFSFIFCLSGIFVFFISLLSLRFEVFKSPFLYIASFASLSTKIQMVIIFLILVSFLSIAVVTSLYFKQILKNNQEKSISAKVVTINNSLQNRLAEITDMQSALNLIETELPRLSEINNLSSSLYNKEGLSLSDTKQILAYPFYPFYQHKAHGKRESFTLQSDNNVSAYFPITHPVLGNIGYISLDDKNNANDSVRSSISEFLSSMLNLYVFLFFIAGALAIAISKSITRPLTALQLRLKSIKFGSKNEAIAWEANDEIGELITSYNDMLGKLEKNLELLAKTERDTAWREMAKQVAHEIKNPLTPMKLSIQYLKRAIQADPAQGEALVDKISNTLIEQIDNLADIANAFSNFATLPQANNDKIVLNEVVEVVHDLFRKRDDMEIKLFEPLNAIEVFADKNHMIRILNNLVKNAIQSIPEERKGVISISLYKDKDTAIIKVEDNGTGIPKALQEKVFTPYFTTKTSGTGLGLAISANMLNAFDGRIHFDTTEGKGTSFFIEIPLMRETYKYHAGEKLILD